MDESVNPMELVWRGVNQSHIRYLSGMVPAAKNLDWHKLGKQGSVVYILLPSPVTAYRLVVQSQALSVEDADETKVTIRTKEDEQDPILAKIGDVSPTQIALVVGFNTIEQGVVWFTTAAFNLNESSKGKIKNI
jgi:hypothetical protein